MWVALPSWRAQAELLLQVEPKPRCPVRATILGLSEARLNPRLFSLGAVWHLRSSPKVGPVAPDLDLDLAEKNIERAAPRHHRAAFRCAALLFLERRALCAGSRINCFERLGSA